MLYVKDMTFGNPALLLCEILLASALCADCIKHISLFIYLFRQKSEGASHTINAQHSTASSKKMGEEPGREGPEPLLLGNLMMGEETVLQPQSVAAALGHMQWFLDLKAFSEHQLIN